MSPEGSLGPRVDSRFHRIFYLQAFLLFWGNIQSIKFVILIMFECPVQWQSAHSLGCATITPSHFQNFSIVSSRDSVPIK